MAFVLENLENFAWKGENADYQHFLISHNVFKKPSFWKDNQ